VKVLSDQRSRFDSVLSTQDSELAILIANSIAARMLPGSALFCLTMSNACVVGLVRIVGRQP